MTSGLSPRPKPYLSVVTVSRNDDHGGDPLIRTQLFVNCLARQCDKYDIDAELIIVDWNPVLGRPGLAEVLRTPADALRCLARIITVPANLHNSLKYAEKLPLFQMIGKNVGICRAQGEFILATNIDVLFSDELMRLIGRRKLQHNKHYRVDRYDIKSGLSGDATLDEALAYAWSHPIRVNRRLHPTKLLEHLYGTDPMIRVCRPETNHLGRFRNFSIAESDGVWQLMPKRTAPMECLHTNACGDFALMSREGWNAIHGYPEFETYSFNIDSIGLIASHYGGYEEVSLLPPCVCFHIEHSAGSGWTPEGQAKLFSRLREQEILSPEWPVLMPLVEEMKTSSKALEFNYSCWGLAGVNLPERQLSDKFPVTAEERSTAIKDVDSRRVGAIRPEFDFDRLTLACERDARHGVSVGGGYAVVAASQVDMRVFLPDTMGRYDRRRSIGYAGPTTPKVPILFSIPEYDLCHRISIGIARGAGLASIRSIQIIEGSGRQLHRLDAKNRLEVGLTGTATCLSERSDDSWLILSTGSDPQLILPLLDARTTFPVMVIVDLDFFPVAKSDTKS